MTASNLWRRRLRRVSRLLRTCLSIAPPCSPRMDCRLCCEPASIVRWRLCSNAWPKRLWPPAGSCCSPMAPRRPLRERSCRARRIARLGVSSTPLRLRIPAGSCLSTPLGSRRRWSALQRALAGERAALALRQASLLVPRVCPPEAARDLAGDEIAPGALRSGEDRLDHRRHGRAGSAGGSSLGEQARCT